uniref:Uncharacterized protein n=1 Tax=Lepeophtheirus salmonis TaxID=72036 RepID=A0A0K2URR8_LEPSM
MSLVGHMKLQHHKMFDNRYFHLYFTYINYVLRNTIQSSSDDTKQTQIEMN